MYASFISFYQIQFATLLIAGPPQHQRAETLTELLTLPPNGYTVALRHKSNLETDSLENSAPRLCSSRQGRVWEKAISYCGLGDRTAPNVEDGLEEKGE